MELYQLRSFATVAELGHLTRAAEKLHLSQPALSAQIKALEEELDVELFERVSSGMSLTPAGRTLLIEAEKVLAAARALRITARALKGEVSGRVRLGTLTDPAFARLGALMARAVERYPMLEIEVHHEVSGAAFEKVRDGALDTSFYYGDLNDLAVGKVPLREIAFRVAAPAAWRSRLEGADWTAIASEPWIMTPPISTHHALATAFFRERGLAPSTLIQADNELVIASLVIAGLGLGLMREDRALKAEAAGEVWLWEGVRFATTLWFLYPRERSNDPPIRAMLDVVADVWPESRRSDDAAPESAQPAR